MTKYDEVEIDLYPWAEDVNRQEMRAKATFAAGFTLAIASGVVLLGMVLWSGVVEEEVANRLIRIATCWSR